MDKQAKKEHAATPVMGMPPGPPATERVWCVGTGSQAYQPRVLMSVGELEIALTAAGAADLVVALIAAFDSAFPVEFRHLQRRMVQVIAMEAKDAPGSD